MGPAEIGTRRGPNPYREVLALPGVAALTAVGFLARIPAAAAALTLTLHVVRTLDHGYAAAGAVGAAATVGMAIGAPLLGRVIDRRGLRPVLVLTVLVQTAFWAGAPWLGYPALLGGALLGGVFGLPVSSVIRQSLVVVVPGERRRPAFALDAMSVETTYIVGPALGALLALQVSTPVALWTVGAGWIASGIALLVLDPPIRSARPSADRPAGPVRDRLGLGLVAALVAATAAVFVVLGSELAVIAGLETSGQAGWLPLVNAVWCLASLTGGFAYGAARRTVPLPLLVAGLGAATLPVALAGPWWSYALLLVPAGLLCAPALAATAEAATALAPEHVRGFVSGLHSSANTLGAAMATPVAGLLVDVASPAVAILTVAVIGTTLAGLAAVAGLAGAGRPASRRGTSTRRAGRPDSPC